MATTERRYFDDFELKQDEETSTVRFRGHAAVFDQMTTIGNMFRERIDAKAFNKPLKDGYNVKFLYNHDPDSVMASVKTGTLRLSTDELGLLSKAELPLDDQDVQRLLPKIRRGDVDQMSFAFQVDGPDGDSWDYDPEDGGLPIRTVKRTRLFDVSPVTFPAYEDTDAELVSARALMDSRPDVKKIIEEQTHKNLKNQFERNTAAGILSGLDRQIAKFEDKRSPLTTKDSPTRPPDGPVIEQVPPQEPGEEPKVVEPDPEPSAPEEPSRDEHSLFERQQALMAQVLVAVERSLEV